MNKQAQKKSEISELIEKSFHTFAFALRGDTQQRSEIVFDYNLRNSFCVISYCSLSSRPASSDTHSSNSLAVLDSIAALIHSSAMIHAHAVR